MKKIIGKIKDRFFKENTSEYYVNKIYNHVEVINAMDGPYKYTITLEDTCIIIDKCKKDGRMLVRNTATIRPVTDFQTLKNIIEDLENELIN